MLLKPAMIVFFLVFATFCPVNAQDCLTYCKKENELFTSMVNQATAETPSAVRGPPGYPGKRGTSGEKGDVGEKGSKGDSGGPAMEETDRLQGLIANLEEKLNAALRNVSDLQKQIENLSTDTIRPLRNKISKLCRANANAGWYAPSNGYQYRLFTSQQAWHASRRNCQRIGGDLAVVGMRDVATRRKLFNEILRSTNRVWIGLTDLAEEGNWVWNDDKPANAENANWSDGEPNNFGNEDCGAINWPGHTDIATVDVPCSSSLQALCEKELPSIC
ncbi:hepatic lectin-like [Clavelina lepadiformis]|uniref:C-type lectin domain-containing protein n=1 Tax=Clavelina lepadiformis TaxID=159417 RepID=A0ABP0FYN6_CLALP